MKRNGVKKKKSNKSVLVVTQERLKIFQTKYPFKFRQVFENYQSGQRQLSRGLIKESKASFEKALSIYQEYIPAQNHLAVIYGILNNYAEALAIVKKVIKLDDKNVFAFIQGAMFLYRLGREKEAENYAKSALQFFGEREGHDPYNDYDMLQKLVEMLSVLRQDAQISEMYKVRKKQLSPMSLYRSALGLSNHGLYSEALDSLQAISGENDLQLKAKSLIENIEIFRRDGLPLPMLYAEDDKGFEQLMVVASLYTGKEHQHQEAIDYLKKQYSNWTLEVIKALLISKQLTDWIKKSLLTVLADWGEADKPVSIILNGEKQQITLQPVELTLGEQIAEVYAEGISLLAEKSYQDAVNRLVAVQQESPTFIPVYLQLAEAYTVLKQFDEAKGCLEDALEIAPIAPVFLGMAKYYVAINDLNHASQYLTRFDTRELEEKVNVFEAISLKVKATAETVGYGGAVTMLQQEKEKFQLVFNDWSHFEEILLTEISEGRQPANEELKKGQLYIPAYGNIHHILERYTKEKLIQLVKAYQIGGYSKLVKKSLIELVVTEIYKSQLWLGKLTKEERQLVDKFSQSTIFEKQLLSDFNSEFSAFLKEVEKNIVPQEMQSTLGKLTAKGVVFIGVSDNNEWVLYFPKNF